MQKKIYYINIITIILLSLVVTTRIIGLKSDSKYLEIYNQKTNNTIEVFSAPRGRILDINGEILVDNQTINVITYRKIIDTTTEKDRATKFLDLNIYHEVATYEELKNYYLETKESDKYLTKELITKLEERKITQTELNEYLLTLITQEDLEIYNEQEQILISLLNIMNDGYSYDTKIIESDVSESICASVIEAGITGFNCEKDTKRVIKNNAISSIYGSLGPIPLSEEEDYLKLDYNIDELAGISYLEKEYNNFLKGENKTYTINNDNSLSIFNEGKEGSDITLSIDIKLIEKINNIIETNLLKAENMNKTDYFNSAYVLVSDVKTGEILALTGRRILNSETNHTFKDITTNILTTSYTVGSIIKGASLATSWNYNLVEPNKKIYDSCVKLYLVPEKCSFKPLGYLDDITALKMSSNYYQFLLAIKMTGQEYKPNMTLNSTEEHFSIYRDFFKNFGLGIETGIDLPGETTGITGDIIADDLLLNLVIGQYDTYTALGLLQYINTIANDGIRYKLNLLNNSEDYNYHPIVLSEIENNEYFSRIQEGLYQVMNGGTGNGYASKELNPVGKTGTSESYYDKNTTTITQTFAMYAPKDDPKYSIVVITPDISFNTDTVGDDYIAPINRLISQQVSQLVFDNY